MLSVAAGERVTLHSPSPLLLMGIEASVGRAACGGLDTTLDRSCFVVVPGGAEVALARSSTAGRFAAVAFHAPLLALVARTHRTIASIRRS